ncbi:MAG: hypothetical protein IMF26_03010 [Candidatus Fermentithermobacillus carboniphilus]|uniref:Uncharacterized protein n=1 Tax=Candidatus Fermentithermobacillus carboniphilus TaxID=3085328 RepID=A0AAT9LD86_9FIRM|nr:MAG: hypothetical protein IMF26_03010 [Candidatus Fermentithermobacillus carboniphilus]
MHLAKRTIPVAIAFVCGIIQVVDYFFKIESVNTWAQEIRSWVSIVAIFALGLGAVNVLRVHLKKVRQAPSESLNSILLLITFLVTISIGLTAGQSSKPYKFIFDYIIVPTGSAIFSLLAFYIGTAAYRAFRAKNAEAAILLVTGCIVMLGKVPLGEKIIPFAPKWTTWIMEVLNVGGQRGVMIAGAIGFVAVSLRIIIGLERRTYGVD